MDWTIKKNMGRNIPTMQNIVLSYDGLMKIAIFAE